MSVCLSLNTKLLDQTDDLTLIWQLGLKHVHAAIALNLAVQYRIAIHKHGEFYRNNEDSLWITYHWSLAAF